MENGYIPDYHIHVHLQHLLVHDRESNIIIYIYTGRIINKINIILHIKKILATAL